MVKNVENKRGIVYTGGNFCLGDIHNGTGTKN